MTIIRTILSSFLCLQLILAQPTIDEISFSSLHNIIELRPPQPIRGSSRHHLLKDVFDVECHHITQPSLPDLQNRLGYTAAGRELCEDLSSQDPATVVRERWIWHTLNECTVGVYLLLHSRVPRGLACAYKYQEISRKCVGHPPINAGTINVEKLPDMEQDGEAIDEAYAMFAIASERLTH